MLLFTAAWCGPCKELKQWLTDKGYEVDIVDIDQDPELAGRKQITMIPTLIASGTYYKGREEIKPYLEKING